MIVYTIATLVRECYGHGSYGNELQILQDLSGNFPPIFKSPEEAEEYLDGLAFHYDKQVVKLKYNY